MPRFQAQGNGYGQLQHKGTVFQVGDGGQGSPIQRGRVEG